MSIINFIKEAGEKVIDLLTPGNAHAGEELKKHVEQVGLGNPNITATVDDQITVSGPAVTAARFVVVKAGDTLSAIAKVEYGDGSKYMKIFEANKPMLSDPNKIYPGQTLRIPE